MLNNVENSPSVIIQHMDGTEYDLNKLGYPVISFNPPSPNWSHTFQQVGKHGAELTDTEVQQLTIPLSFDILADDIYDLELKRLELYRIFKSDEEFYVIYTKMPYVRWKCVANPFDVTQLNNYHKAKSVNVSLICPDGLSESVYTTLTSFDFKNYSTETYGLHLPNGKNLKYEWDSSDIKIYNGSLIPLLAEEHPVIIKFKGIAHHGIKLKNNTTGQEINIYRSLSKENELIWYGLVPTIDGIQQYGNGLSDHSYLDFAVGWNDLKLIGAYDFKISFETRFYY